MYRKEKNLKDIKYILHNLRNEDKHEIISQFGENYIEEYSNLIMKRNDYFVLGCKKSDDTPVCMGGIADTDENGIGMVWLLCTPEIVNYQHCLLRNIKKDIQFFDKNYWFTFNYIFKENYLAKKWLSKFGYKFDKTVPNLPNDFELFYRTRKTRGLSRG